MIEHREFMDYLPFFSLMTGRPPATPFITRLIETAVMSVVAGAVGVYVGVEVIKNDLIYIKQGQTEINHKIEQVDSKVEQLRRDLYVPRGAVGS